MQPFADSAAGLPGIRASVPATDVAGESGLGLSSSAAAERLRIDGPNELPSAPTPSALRLIAAQMFHFFAVLLWIAGGLAIVAGMPELGVTIFLVIVVNGLFAYVQEYRAESAARHLRALLPRRAIVEREATWVELDARELVVGDLLKLAAARASTGCALDEVQAARAAVDLDAVVGEIVLDGSAFEACSAADRGEALFVEAEVADPAADGESDARAGGTAQRQAAGSAGDADRNDGAGRG